MAGPCTPLLLDPNSSLPVHHNVPGHCGGQVEGPDSAWREVLRFCVDGWFLWGATARWQSGPATPGCPYVDGHLWPCSALFPLTCGPWVAPCLPICRLIMSLPCTSCSILVTSGLWHVSCMRLVIGEGVYLWNWPCCPLPFLGSAPRGSPAWCVCGWFVACLLARFLCPAVSLSWLPLALAPSASFALIRPTHEWVGL